MTPPSVPRRVLLVTHETRPDAQQLAAGVAARLLASGIGVSAPTDDLDATPLARVAGVEPAPADPVDGRWELVCVLGGDGSILRGAELSRGSGAPLLGVNLGHVGFLAEAEREHLDSTVERICARDYTVEDRMTLEVTAVDDGQVVFSSWALNEVTVEKASRERMLELTVEIDGRPLSTWGCDGIVMATPTGSTAYAFSAGGPVVWPDVEALLLVPISAHALFSRPVVVGPRSHLAVEVLPHTVGSGVVWCDGRRAVALPPGARVQVQRSAEPVRVARLGAGVFTDRLVEKFDLPVHGWRGGAGRRVRPEGRQSSGGRR
ncbi:MAG: NAD kinase [Dermatophilaceae bacterium]